MLSGLTKWLDVRLLTDSLKATRDRDTWKVIITYIKNMGPD